MGVIAEVQLADAIEALLERDANKATRVIESNSQLDNLKTEVDELVVQRLVSPQPIAKILWVIITALKTASITERIGGYAKGIAKRSIAISQFTLIGPTKTIGRMGGQVQSMIKNVLDAHVTRYAVKAEYVHSMMALLMLYIPAYVTNSSIIWTKTQAI